MFKLEPNPTFWLTAEIPVAGEPKPRPLELEFKYFDRDQLTAFFSNLEGLADSQVLEKLLVGWQNVDTPYSETAVETLLRNFPLAGSAIFDAFRKEVTKAREKN